jgi:hypothetical protein
MALYARSVLEHLGHAEGMADVNCGDCPSIRIEMGRYCEEWGIPLRSNGHGPVKCFACRRTGDPLPMPRKERND